MSQHDYLIDNALAPAFRSDLNAALAATVTQNSGATAPPTTYANMLWYDTTNHLLKIRNEANSGWITVGTVDQTNNVFNPNFLPATQVEAEAGTNNTKGMTALRVSQAIAALTSAIDTQPFSASGTWTKPAGASLVLVRIFGAGGGGGGGARSGAGAVKYGASGGGGGAFYERWFYPTQLPATVSVTIGAGGAAGLASTGAGGAGGSSSFGAFIVAVGGGGGGPAGALSGIGPVSGLYGTFLEITTVPSIGYYNGGPGGSVYSGKEGALSVFGGGGGGASGGESSGNVLNSPAAGGKSGYNVGGLAGTSVAGAPTAGGAGLFIGSGGGGGGSAQTANGASGGNGNIAGGGGGGGSTRTGFTAGAGGAGGAGYCEVYTW